MNAESKVINLFELMKLYLMSLREGVDRTMKRY
jgi:hypothetical protein